MTGVPAHLRAIMHAQRPAVFAWSGGKDSTLALHALRQGAGREVGVLLTTVTAEYDRISMHGVRRSLLEEQARSLGLSLETVELSPRSSNEEYRAKMEEALAPHREQGVTTVIYGDIFLEDVRRYREAQLAGLGMRAVFPLWGEDTAELAHRFLTLGYRAVVTCVDSHALDPEFAGREYDPSFLHDLPRGVDPCGENGEFHTFVFDGPLFRDPVAFEPGEVVRRDERFYFWDLLPAVRPG